MQSLQVLIIGDGTFSSDCAITYLPSGLCFIEWQGYPSYTLLDSLEPSQLIVLCLQKSWLVELWPISKGKEKWGRRLQGGESNSHQQGASSDNPSQCPSSSA